MRTDGKENVKERIKVFENEKYITYLYIFENGNSYKDTVLKWKQKHFSRKTAEDTEDKIDKRLEKWIDKRCRDELQNL